LTRRRRILRRERRLLESVGELRAGKTEEARCGCDIAIAAFHRLAIDLPIELIQRERTGGERGERFARDRERRRRRSTRSLSSGRDPEDKIGANRGARPNGELVSSLSQISAGVTTTTDTSQVSHTPAHNDAIIAALKESGHRVVYTYSPGMGDATQYPHDLPRIMSQYFSSTDQLLTLVFNAQPNIEDWKLAKKLETPLICHIVGTRFGDLEAMGRAGLMGPECTYIHCTNLNDNTWAMIADTGGSASIAPAIEMQMRHGLPPFQQALDRHIPIALSADVECNMTADFFTIMRSTFTIQRALANERAIAGEKNVPRLFGSRDVIELATMGGARASHIDAKVGSLTLGKEADIVMLDANRINVFPLNNVPGTVVTLMDTSNVEHVFIAGKAVKWAGELVGVDLARLRRDIDKSRDGMLERSKFSPNLFGSCV
jgi:5-methylthioadenosine/S-adenosylhomocysteine deaminase